MVSNWLLFGQRAGPLLVRAFSLGRQIRPSAQLLGELALGGLLVAALAISPHDATPSAGYDDAWTTQVVTPYQSASGDQPQFGFTLPGLQNLSNGALKGGKAVITQALIPTY